MFTKFTIEDGFAEDDPIWSSDPDKSETHKDVEKRVRAVLDNVFQDSNADAICDSLLVL